jgi:hypothetical protein
VHIAGTGIALRVTHRGWITLAAPAGKTVVIDGPRGNPYLRFDDGVVYRHATRPSRWRKVAVGRTWSWQDFGTRRGEWHVAGTVNGKPFEAQGALPPRRSNGWVPFIPIAVAGAVLVAMRRRQRRRPRE